ncbi:YfiR family protein [Methylomarinum sp. Ch1-1]|uniref:YfiR family protein n=1 Tax=Methylomarinum roseum TaxID=3067653 RepID=A0AAU7NXE7_9GAMM|nr:YfiR family protein [Methylomarinum sp. Ch1-1]MDP4522281.1 YfiR family protein [Methylomarinum sp. Ch1-1]
MLLIRTVIIFFCFSALVFAKQPALEYKVKAAYLYNFTKFISWPDKQSETFNLCILGEDPFGPLLKPLEQRSAMDKPIHLIRLDTLDQARQCHMLYIGDETRVRSAELAASSAVNSLHGVLTVSSQPSFAKSGGMIGFVIKEGRVRLQVNLAALKKNGLKISAKLMEVAELVVGDYDE